MHLQRYNSDGDIKKLNSEMHKKKYLLDFIRNSVSFVNLYLDLDK